MSNVRFMCFYDLYVSLDIFIQWCQTLRDSIIHLFCHYFSSTLYFKTRLSYWVTFWSVMWLMCKTLVSLLLQFQHLLLFFSFYVKTTYLYSMWVQKNICLVDDSIFEDYFCLQPLRCFLFVVFTDQRQWAAPLEANCGQVHDWILLKRM